MGFEADRFDREKEVQENKIKLQVKDSEKKEQQGNIKQLAGKGETNS